MSRRRKVQFNNGSNIKETLYNQDCIDLIIPIGTILPYTGVVLPSNKFKFCDGEELSRGTYSKLFNIIGERYGTGDGVLTFNLPNLTGRFLECTDNIDTVGLYKEAGLPEITGYVQYPPAYNATGAFKKSSHNTSYRQIRGETSTTYYSGDIRFNASDSNPIYGKSTTVQPKSLTVNYIIRVI